MNDIKEARDKIVKDFKVPNYHIGPEPELRNSIKWLIAFLRLNLKWHRTVIKIKVKYYFKNLLNRFSIFKERDKNK